MWALTGEEHQEDAVGQVQAVIETSFTTPFPKTAICKGSPQALLKECYGRTKA